jgi:hypothetical protein
MQVCGMETEPLSAGGVEYRDSDYITAVSGGNKVFATWADGRNGVPDTFFAPIDGAGKSSH